MRCHYRLRFGYFKSFGLFDEDRFGLRLSNRFGLIKSGRFGLWHKVRFGVTVNRISQIQAGRF